MVIRGETGYYAIMNEIAYSPLHMACFILNLLLGIFLIIIPSEKKKANVSLGLLLIMVAFSMGGREIVSYYTDLPAIPDRLFRINVFLFAFGPLLHLYIAFITEPRKSLHPLLSIHLLPMGLAILLSLSDLSDTVVSILDVLKILHVLLYSLWAILKINKIEKTIVQVYSSIPGGGVRWIKNLVLWFLGTFIYLSVIGIIILLSENQLHSFFTDELFILIITVWIITFWYKGMRQPEILNLTLTGRDKKYSHSRLTDDIKNRHYRALTDYINESRIFLDYNLTIKDLSDSLNIPLADLSQVINEIGKAGFFDFINRFRVEEFIGRLKQGDDQSITILGLALECGFNSKSAFYSAFKKETGLSPGQYKKEKGL